MKIIIDDQIELIQFKESLAETYFSAIHNTKNYNDKKRLYLQKKFPNIELLKLSIEYAVTKKLKKDGTPDFLIFYKQKIVGVFQFCHLPKDDYLEVTFWLFAENYRQGIMSKIFPHMIALAKENFSKSKIMTTCHLGNVPAQKFLTSLGFEKGGIMQIEREDGRMDKESVYFLIL